MSIPGGLSPTQSSFSSNTPKTSSPPHTPSPPPSPHSPLGEDLLSPLTSFDTARRRSSFGISVPSPVTLAVRKKTDSIGRKSISENSSSSLSPPSQKKTSDVHRASLILASSNFSIREKNGSMSLIISTPEGAEKAVGLKASTQVNLPKNAKEQIATWKENPETWINKKETDPQKEIKRQERLSSRIEYEESDIGKALNKFKDLYECSWHKMVHASDPAADITTLQIINDFRSANLSTRLTKLLKDYPSIVDKKDFGSDKLTSDRDIALIANSELWNKNSEEAKGVAAFNKDFEAEWGAPSADVFDINAYTMQYLESAIDPEVEQKRTDLQQEASLLLKFRTGTRENWEEFTSSTLSKITNPDDKALKEEEFKGIEEQSKKLDFQLNREICKMGVDDEAFSKEIKDDPLLPQLKNILKEGVEDASPEDMTIVAKFAAELKKVDSNVTIKASNSLHEEIKSNIEDLEFKRAYLLHSMKELNKTNTPSEFASRFNDAIDFLVKPLIERTKELSSKIETGLDESENEKLNNELEEVKTQFANIASARLSDSPEEQTKAMDAFKEMTRLNDQEKEITGSISNLDQLKRLVKKSDQLEKELASMNKVPKDVAAINKLNDKLKTNREEMQGLADKLGMGQIVHQSQEDMTAALSTLREKRNELTAALGQLDQEKNQFIKNNKVFWEITNKLSLHADYALLEMQEANLKGMQFAQEAHVSEGAVSVVVFNIQAGSSEVRTINQYMEALREISGYFSGHQEHQSISYGKMIEGSKYADRLIQVSNFLIEKADDLGITPPNITNDKNKLETFFKTVTPLRGTGQRGEILKDAVRLAAVSSGISTSNSNNSNLFEEITLQVNKIAVELLSNWEAWITDGKLDQFRNL